MLNRDQLYPALALGAENSEPVGHGLVVRLIELRGSEQHIIGPDELRAANLTADEARRIALENLARFADESSELSIQILGGFLLYADHPLASSCLLLPDLYEHASEELKETELLACVPQRDSLVVFPKRDREHRESLVRKLREIEDDAEHPLSFELFAISPGGVTEWRESSVQAEQ